MHYIILKFILAGAHAPTYFIHCVPYEFLGGNGTGMKMRIASGVRRGMKVLRRL